MLIRGGCRGEGQDRACLMTELRRQQCRPIKAAVAADFANPEPFQIRHADRNGAHWGYFLVPMDTFLRIDAREI